jgi:hypothetical protein
VSSAAIVLAAVLGAWATLAADREQWLPGILAAGGVALLAVALAWRRSAPIAWSLALIGGAYAARVALGAGNADTLAPLEAAGLLLVGELSYESIERRLVPIPEDLLARRVGLLAALVASVIALGALLLMVAAIPLKGGVALTAVGVSAAAVAFTLLARLARRAPR